MPPKSIGFHCKIVFFFIVLRHQLWGVPFGEPEKLIFLIQYKEIGHFGWPVCLLKRCSLGTSDIQGCYLPKGITYMIYTLIHERNPIPCRTTYIEYRSPVNIYLNHGRLQKSSKTWGKKKSRIKIDSRKYSMYRFFFRFRKMLLFYV